MNIMYEKDLKGQISISKFMGLLISRRTKSRSCFFLYNNTEHALLKVLITRLENEA
jgi:hypothetical protein